MQYKENISLSLIASFYVVLSQSFTRFKIPENSVIPREDYSMTFLIYILTRFEF